MRTRTAFRCVECDGTAPRWLGRCPECGGWGTLVEQAVDSTRSAPVPTGSRPALPITAVDPMGAARRPSGLGELDRVLGGGLVAGSVTLLGGEPGIGKSTLVLQALARMAQDGARCLLVTAEESCEQVRLRAERLGTLPGGLLLAAAATLPEVIAHVDVVAPDVLAVDSIQALSDPSSSGVPGSLAQVRDCAQQLVRDAKEHARATLMVGHVTKEGTLAGPRTLEHMVDTVLSFEGERHHALRLLRALKHRFGSTHELGVFEMGDSGLTDVPDPSALFLADRRLGAPGSVVAPVLEGSRPLLVEVQALVSGTKSPVPRRVTQGFDAGRLALLLAVLERHGRLAVGEADVFASIAGGVRVSEAGADLALTLAAAGARHGRAVAADLVVLGEVGLGGEVRQVHSAARRLHEAARLGFARALVPLSTPDVPGIDVVRVADVRHALDVAYAEPRGAARAA